MFQQASAKAIRGNKNIFLTILSSLGSSLEEKTIQKFFETA